MLYGSVGRVGLRALLGSVAFTPLSLFAAGEQGVWLDNSDFTTLFQDAAGTTPVSAVEQPVGLRLDKSRGLVLGSELVSNGTFDSNTTGWTAGGSTLSVVSGFLRVTNSAGSFGSAEQAVTTVIGKSYKLTFTVGAQTNTSSAWIGTSSGGTQYRDFDGVSAGTYSMVFTATSTTAYLRFLNRQTTTGNYSDFDNISVRELPGNHAYQTTAASRPVLSARYNLLTETEAFDNAAWTKFRSSVSANTSATTDPLGGNTADKLIPSNALVGGFVYNTTSVSGVSGVAYTASVYVKAAELGFAFVSINNRGSSVVGGACINLTTGQLTNQGASGTFSVTNAGNGWWQIFCTATNNSTANYIEISPLAVAGSYGSYTGDGTSGIYIWGADLRVSNESSALPPYQRVGAAVNGTSTSIGTPDYDTVGFPAYLRYDGGDWYQTNSIDFSTGATNPPLGPELVTNGTFDANLNGWSTSNVVWSAGAASFTGSPSLSQSLSTTNGIYYQVSITISGIVGGTLWVRFVGGTASNSNSYGNGTFTFLLRSNGNNTLLIEQYSGTVTAGSIDNISVKALDANYAPDKMSVFAGVRKLSDALTGVIVELSSDYFTSNGSFILTAPPSNGVAQYGIGARGNNSGYAAMEPFTAPTTNIVTELFDIGASSATDELRARVNGAAVTLTGVTGSLGTGNFGNYPLYIGARSGPSLWFTGREYETIVLGRAVTATELANTEDYMEVQTFGKNMAYVYTDPVYAADGVTEITAADGDPIYMSVSYV